MTAGWQPPPTRGGVAGRGAVPAAPPPKPGPERIASANLAEVVRAYLRSGTTGNRERMGAALRNYDEQAWR